MNSAQLLTHFDRISDAPESIPRLRRFILDLAVRGRLVEQHPARESVHNDYIKEPTSEEFPANWRILNFGKFCDIQGGNQPSKNQFVDEPRSGYIRLFQIRDLGENPVPTYIPKDTTNRFCRAGEILIGRYGASVGKIFWAQDGAYNVALAKFIYPQNAYVPHFAFLVLKSAVFQAKLTGSTRSAQAGFNKGDLADIALPLPPLAEQHRIVSKVDELMALCDRLKAAQAERENWRDRLVASSLNRLNDGAAAEVFRDHARFYFNHLPLLSTKPEHIQQLRQTILNLAVHGKLVSQISAADEGCSIETLADKHGRVADLDESGSDSEMSFGAPPFPAPDGWKWARVRDVLITRQGVQIPKEQQISGAKPGYKRYLYISDFRHDDKLKYVLDQFPAKEVTEEDLVMANTAGPGEIFRGVSGILSNNLFKIVFDRRLFAQNYLFIFFMSPVFTSAVEAEMKGGAQQHLGHKLMGKQFIVIPPLAEQQRIVAKVDELMALCDRLEAQLTITQTESRRLLESVLHEALAPAV